MKSRANSLSYDINRKALEHITTNKTVQSYKKSNRKFVDWAKDNGYKTYKQIEDNGADKVIQKYASDLVEGSYSPSTIHTYLAPVCKAFDVNMSQIDKPQRTSDAITRSRLAESNSQGNREQLNDKYSRLVIGQSAIGIRREELSKLQGKDLVYQNGYLCVHVERGKGGKEQFQRILPQHEQTVKDMFAGKGENEKIFSREEMNNKIDLHSIRADVAKQAYAYYCERLDKEPEYREILKGELIDYYNQMNEKVSEHAKEQFYSHINDDRPYYLRGANREKAIQQGQETKFDRLSVMAVSVFHLSHWRDSVTVTNYLL